MKLDWFGFCRLGSDRIVLEYHLRCSGSSWLNWILAWVFLNSLDNWEILWLTSPRNSNWIPPILATTPSLPPLHSVGRYMMASYVMENIFCQWRMEFTCFQWKYFYRKLTRVVQYSWHEPSVPVRPIQAIETAPKGFQSLEVVKRCQSGHNCFFCQRVAIVSLNYGKSPSEF